MFDIGSSNPHRKPGLFFLKSLLLQLLPRPLRRTLQRWHYPRVLRRFTADQCPFANAIRPFVGEGDLVVDVGANVGYISRMLSDWVGPEGRVISLEPVPETCALLRHGLRTLGVDNVEIHCLGASSRTGPVTMAIPHDASGVENLYESHVVSVGEDTSEIRKVEAELVSLDELLADRINEVRLVKVDVEGHEWDAIQGAKALIRASRPVLVIEMNEDPDVPGSNAAQLGAWLAKEGYAPFLAEGDRLVPRETGRRAIDYIFLPTG